MPGTKIGGLKARDTNIRLYGKDYYANVSRKGGSVLGVDKGFYRDPERARAAGAIGGTKRWEGRLGVQQEEMLSYLTLSPAPYGTGPRQPANNRRIHTTLLSRALIEYKDDLLYPTAKGMDYLQNYEVEHKEATSQSLKVESVASLNFSDWFPICLFLSLCYTAYTVIHWYLILGTLWAK